MPRHPPKPRNRLPAALAALALACGGPPDGPQLGARLPPLPLRDGVAAPWEGGAAVLLAWALDCRPCGALRAQIDAAPPPSGVPLLPVHLGVLRPDADTPGPALLDGPPAPLADALAIDALPLLLVLDADGVVRSRGASWVDARSVAVMLAGEGGG